MADSKDEAEDSCDSSDSEQRSILHEGYLYKKGQINRSWKRRYFILYSDKRLAYFINKEAVISAPINEINLSTIKELSLLQYSPLPKKKPSSARLSAKSFTDMFAARSPRQRDRGDSKNSTQSESSIDRGDLDDPATDTIDTASSYSTHSVYVDATVNPNCVCARQHAFEVATDKRPYWLQAPDAHTLSEWIIRLKYAIFGKRILDGFIQHRTRKLNGLKTLWKMRYVEIYESQIVRVYKDRHKHKVKLQIDVDVNAVSVIKHGHSDTHSMPFPIEIYDADHNLQHG